ncbi:MAG TPA: cytochrome c peroxidase [Casimicrobiaceae bacterium]|jgi:cytochrome c peroxidase
MEMRVGRMRLLSASWVVAFVTGLCSPTGAVELDEPIRPLPADLKFDTRKIELGRKLFVDARLSQDGAVSCASCHDFSRGGADPRPRSIGVRGEIGGANAPSVFNSGLNFRQTWNGSGGSLEEFLERLIKNPKVFDSNWTDVVGKLRQDPALSGQFEVVYTEGITNKTAIDAIATFVRSLLTPSRFDRYLRGDAGAISTEELQGYTRFKSYGCVACHQGVNVGGNMFQKFGVMGDYFAQRGNITPADLGRYNVTKRESDKFVFKVPSLRNVELTGPYFHDGSATTLEAAVEIMFRYQLGRDAPREDKALIVKFLKTLTGERQPRLASLPDKPNPPEQITVTRAKL